ncbi:MAG: hypothetical protein JNK65_04395, partial [Deltaproteobacteria bacterium]|nr:hypothetical protein [Deltaproteobacteria bacterium]
MSEGLLQRLSTTSLQESLSLTSTQALVDQTIHRFSHEIVQPNTLASIAVGGLFSQVARLGVLSAGAGRISTPVLQVLSQGTSLFAESVAFEGTSRSLSYLQGDRSRPLFQWSGEQGWSRALPANLITFGVLRGSGHVLRDQNFVVQQLVSSGSLV